MKIDIKWQLILASLCLVLVVAVVGQDQQAAGSCSSLVPSQGGRVVEGLVGQPTFLNPLLDHRNPIDRHLTPLIFSGLTKSLASGQFAPDLAEDWTILDEGRRIRFNLRTNVLWHDGHHFSADDVLFTYRLIQEESFPAAAQVKEFWSRVDIEQPDDSTIDIVLAQPYAPLFEATAIGILPAHILGNVDAEAITGHEFNRLPIGTGPFLVASSSSWERTGLLRLAPNPRLWPDGAGVDLLEFRFYADYGQVIDAYEREDILAVSLVDLDAIQAIALLDDIRLFSYGRPALAQLIFNLAEEGTSIVQSIDGRRALAMALDRSQIVDLVAQGQGILVNGPLIPDSWAYHDSTSLEYDLQRDEARGILDTLGWIRDEASPIRSKDGRPLILKFAYIDEPLHTALVGEIVDQWKELGIGAETRPVPLGALDTSLAQGDYDVFLATIDLPADPDLYDFWSQQAILDGQNYGNWNHRWASEALEAGRQVYDVDQRLPYYRAFLKIFDENLPALTLYQPVQTYAISEEVRNVEIGRQSSSLDRYQSLSEWTVLMREEAVPCPEEEAG